MLLLMEPGKKVKEKEEEEEETAHPNSFEEP